MIRAGQIAPQGQFRNSRYTHGTIHTGPNPMLLHPS